MANRWEGSSKPTILNITVPEVKKIKQPTKYYVYKLFVEWSNGHSETIYRRYSQFFDFQTKLFELFGNSEDINGLLPELPGKILFGRSQVHHVAEKRRGKIEEFCQAVSKLPPAISESSVVQGFFSIWPEDTSSSESTSCGFREALSPSNSVGSLSSIPTSPTNTLTADYEMWMSTDIPINEELLQYRATENYIKKDSQQVNLTEGQTVSVIDRCDTGWWMVLAGDEQGYAPASLLESIDGSSSADDDTFNDQEGLYEAVGEYKAVNQDELSIKQGDTVQVLNRSMDGWWEISSDGKTGFVPGSVMMKSSTIKMLSTLPSASQLYCKDMNVFNPPPRRNKAGKTSDGIYDIPRKDKLAIKTATTPHSSSDEDDSAPIYAIPRPSTNSADTVDGPPTTENIKASDRNGFSSDHTYEMEPVKNRSSSPHQTNGPVPKKKPLIPRKVMTKAGSDSAILTDLRTSGSVKECSHTTVDKLDPAEEEDYIQMDPTNTPPLDHKSIFATGPRRKKNLSVTPAKPLPYAKRQTTSTDATTQLSPLLKRMSRSHSFDNILDIGLPSDWSAIVDKKKGSPKSNRQMMFGSVVRSNTNASNNSKASTNSSEEQGDNYVELNRTTLVETFTAVEAYVAQSDICLSFNTDDCCALLRKTDQNWWLVNIGGKEGWVPGTFWTPSSHLTTSKFASPPLFPPPERQEKVNGSDVIYANQVVVKRPLTHTKSTPAVPDKPRRAPPKPKLPADLAADIRTSRKLKSPPITDEVPPTTPSRYTSLRSTSSRGSTPDPDIIPINAPNRNSNEYENSPADYENTDSLVNSFNSSLEMQRSSPVHGRSTPTTPNQEQKPAVPSRSRAETSFHVSSKPSIMHRERADTTGDALSPSPPKPRSMTVASFPQRKHDYEEINDDLEQQPWYFGRMNREATETLLKEHGRQCEFLIRERSNKNGFYALSIKHHLSVRHFNIDPEPSTNTYIMGTMKFDSIFGIIKYYQDNSLFLNNGVAVKLGQPVRRRSRVESSTRKC